MTPYRVPRRAAAITPPQFDLLNARAAELRTQGHPVISLGQALPGFGPPQAALDAVRAALERTNAHVYSADAGRLSLRRALCERLAADGVHADPDELIVTAGGNQAFMLALMTLVDPGDEVLLPGPYFVNHEMAIAAFGAVPREVPLSERNGFTLRWQDLEPHITSRTRGVVVCTPSNPTGAVIPEEHMARVARELAERGIVLFADETYARFVHTGRFSSLASVDGWRNAGVVVSTFSKSFGMTGWRVGYLLARRDVCDAAIKIQDAMIICAPVPLQIGVEAAIRDGWRYPEAFGAELKARRDVLADRLNRIPRLCWTAAPAGFFAFVSVEGCADSAALAREILERAYVVTIPGSTFGTSGEGYLRLSYSSVSREELDEAIGRLHDFFKS